MAVAYDAQNVGWAEAGLVVPVRTGLWFAINGRYQWSPTGQNIAGADFGLEYYQVNVGFMWEQ